MSCPACWCRGVICETTKNMNQNLCVFDRWTKSFGALRDFIEAVVQLTPFPWSQQRAAGTRSATVDKQTR